MSSAFDLSAQDWAALRGLLDEALAIDPAARTAWLDGLDDARHAALKPRLRSLLAQTDHTALRMLDTLPKVETDQFAPRPPGAQAEAAGGSVGPYRLLRELGSGGMASVWLAERTDMLQRRQVALKLPHGAWKRAGLAERLAREREILATLEHPNIARLYDAGVTDEGQPWLALEYVQGERIDAHAARHALAMQARIGLFLQVARAVAHAHAQLVVHRDLKPSNILVTEAGDAKLLDFGIAKLLDQGIATETELTREAGRALTPEYAAPEQLLGRPVGTAADVYALGVLLYELLADTRPYRVPRDSRAAIEEAVLHAEPPRLSSAAPPARRRALRGDLDTIVLKALKKDPALRYATVDALAEDLQRHLDHRPVLAQPDSVVYQLLKFVRRHQLEVAGAAAIALALVGGAALALWQAQLARAEQQRAEQVKDFIAAIFKEANPFQQGSGKALTGAELLRLARDRLAAAPPTEVSTHVELLTLLGSGLLALEDVAGADPILALAAEEAMRHLGSDHPSLLRAEIQRAEAARVRERPDEARAILEKHLPALRARAGEHPADLTAAVLVLARVADKQARPEVVDALVAEGMRVIDRHLGARHADRQALQSLSALSLRQRGMAREALQAAEQAWKEALAMHPNARHPLVAEAQLAYAHVLADNGRMREAVQAVRAVLADTEAIFGPDSRRLASRLGNSAEIVAEAGAVAEGIRNATRARAILLPLVPARSRLDGASSEAVALSHLWSRDGGAAVPHFERAESIYAELFGAEHWTVLVTRRNRSLALTHAGRLDEAESLLSGVQARSPRLARDSSVDANAWIAGMRERLRGRLPEALRWQEQALASMSDIGGHQAPRVRSLAERGLVLLDQGRTAEARADFEQAIRIHAGRDSGMVAASADAELGLARIELAEGRAALALPRMERVDAFWRELGVHHRWAGEAAYWLARAHTALGRRDEAADARARALETLRASPFASDRRLIAELAR
ncbi:MAG TPA: protein kinase [Burkholderiaceae bacterium]